MLSAKSAGLFFEDRYVEIPERKTKVGALKCVIHIVKYKNRFVAAESIGSQVILPLLFKNCGYDPMPL